MSQSAAAIQTPVQFSSPEIAVVGMGCYYPGASDLRSLWENILSRRRQFRRSPDIRLPNSEYYDPDPQAPDKTYGDRAAVIDGFEFDWVKRRIPKTAYESTDIVHWLALETALKAIEDLGYTRETVPTERTGLILGNTLTGEQTRSTTVRLRWPFVRRALRAAAAAKGMSQAAIEELVALMEEVYKSAFAPITEDSLAGGLSNTIAGRVCNFFNFQGGGYTVDGACSSSLIAIATAANALVSGDLDLALAGGVDVSLDTFELIGFAKTGALTSQDMTVYDRRASGFIPGEGCGCVALKRLEDARRDGNYVYAVLHGWAISSDGKGGITAPSKLGQSNALRRAYERAGYSSHQLDFIEGHGTGTPVGDRTELEGIALTLAAAGTIAPRSVGVTSFKSLVGHTKAAAGVGGFIKAVMAVNQRVLPPTCGCKDPNPIFDTVAEGIYPILQGEVRDPNDRLKAGISAMGFGGINCHVTIASGDAPCDRLKPILNERALLVSHQDTEVFVFSAASIPELVKRVAAIATEARDISLAELADLAAQLAQQVDDRQPLRAAVIAESPKQLVERLNQLQDLAQGDRLIPGSLLAVEQDIWVGYAVRRDRVAFLFPGQGSQQLNMARVLVERHGWAQELLHQADQWLEEIGCEAISPFIHRPLDRAANPAEVQTWMQQLTQADVAPSAICFASLLWKQYLGRLGIKPTVVGGHSLGELTAFHTAGAYDEKTLLQFAAIRGKATILPEEKAGTMVSLGCDRATAEQLLQQVSGYIVVANINHPQQTVISGEHTSIEQAIKLAAEQNIPYRQLAVANAFHSAMVEDAAIYLRTHAPIPAELEKLTTSLFSATNGQPVQPGISLHGYFAQQLTAQVDFIALVNAIAPLCDLMVEVGTGRVLSGLVQAITEGNPPHCFTVEAKAGDDRSLNTFLGSFFVQGGAINWDVLYENRLLRPFVAPSQRLFISNPCENPLQVPETQPFAPAISNEFTGSAVMLPLSEFGQSSERELVSILSNYFTNRSEFLAELIHADLQLFPFSPNRGNHE
jgi:enediyne polyketide synthase